MKKQLLGLLLALGGLLIGRAAQAQADGYAAPGFPIMPMHRVPLEPRHSAPRLAKQPDDALPRFWHEADPEKQNAGRTRFFEFVMQNAKYPDAALSAKNQPEALIPTGRLYISVLVRPDGTVRQPPRIARRELALPENMYLPAAIQALDAEAQRVLGALHFVRSKSALDSLIVPMRFMTQSQQKAGP